MKPGRNPFCILSLLWLALSAAYAAEPAPAGAGETARPSAVAPAKTGLKPKAKPQPRNASPAKARAPAKGKPQPPAKGKAQPPAKGKPQPPVKGKPQPKAKAEGRAGTAAAAVPDASPERQPSRADAPLPKADAVGSPPSTPTDAGAAVVAEAGLDADVAAARRAIRDNPGDAKARERLARITIELIDELLRAEAVGNTARAAELTQKLRSELHDTGWRVQKMAEGGDLMAYQASGVLLERGLLLEKDAGKSCADFLMAAEQFASAGWHAAKCLMQTAPDKAWLQMDRAAVKGHAAAQEWMGRRCLGEFGAAEPDYSCARLWLAQAASQGRPRSQTLLAYLLMNGHGGPVDVPRAARLYRLAAEQGEPNAQNNLGEIHEMGHATQPNPEEAIRWYERAAEQGLSAAQFNAGRLWAIGIGEKRNFPRARLLLVQAEDKGIAQARLVLNWLDRQSPQAPAAPPAEPAVAPAVPAEPPAATSD